MATKKPCPGCKEPNTGRELDDVCRTCRRRLNASIEQEELDEKRKSEGEELVGIPWFWPYFAVHSNHCSGESIADNLAKAFINLVRTFGRPEPRCSDTIDEWNWSIPVKQLFPDRQRQESARSKRSAVWLPSGCAKAIADLDEAVRKAIDLAYHNGKRKGQDLIGGLASGDISLNELNKKTITGEN